LPTIRRIQCTRQISTCGVELFFSRFLAQSQLLHRNRHLHTSGLFQQLRRAGLVDVGRLGDDALRTIDQLLVRRLHVDHQVPVDRAGADHHARREHVEHKLGRGACLQARRAGDNLGTGDRRNGNIGDARHLRRRDACKRDGQQAHLLCLLHCTEHVGCAARGGDADQRVRQAAFAEALCQQVGRALFA